MSRAVDSVAKTYLDGNNVTEGALNRIEAAIRAYDPCLSCSTHAIGQMPLELVFVDKDDNEIRRYTRKMKVNTFQIAFWIRGFGR